MYQAYFGLVAAPFSIAPDPRYLYMSERHQEALATLLYGLRSDGGFVLLTGEVGAGKTTICRCLLEQIPESCDVGYLFNPKLTAIELLSSICDEFCIGYRPGTTSIKQFVDLINAYLLDAHARGRRSVLIIDEAQNLSAEVLEQMRLLTNLETNERKLLQILLLGQPELARMLARPELRQLAQRIVARYHLQPLNEKEIASYVTHRLEVAGAQRQLFPDALWPKLYKLSGGVPRIINVLCDRALLGVYVQHKQQVDRATLIQAAREVLNRRPPRRALLQPALVASALLLLAGVTMAAVYRPAKFEAILAAAAQETIGQLGHSADPAPAAPPSRQSGPPAAAPAQPIPVATGPAPGGQETGRGVTLPLPGEPLPHFPGANQDGAEKLPATLDLPPDVPRLQSEQLAMAALLRTWGVAYREGKDACRQAMNSGLQCRTIRGGFEELRLLDTPVMLHLVDARGRKFYGALTRLDEKSATVDFGAISRDVSSRALALQWSGEYTMLLHLPPDIREIRIGDRGPAVAWLARQLEQLQGKTAETPDDAGIFNRALQRQVKQFQFSHGLAPDGFVGLKTIVQLSAAADQQAPRLSQAHMK